MLNGAFLHEAEAEVHELSLLQDRLSEADMEEFVTADQIEEWVGSWFTPSELPPPDLAAPVLTPPVLTQRD